MKKITILSIAFAIFCTTATFAQSADRLTEMIKTKEASWGQACYFSAVYSGFISEDAPYSDAINALKEKGYFNSTPDEASLISLKDYANICVKTFNIKGSLFYTIFKTPRYAFRLLKANGLIPSSSDPSKISTGHEALDLFTICMDKYGEGAAE